MSSFVLDASVALSWVFEDEYSPYADALSAIVPRSQVVVLIIWPLEMANAMVTAVRRGRLEEAKAPSWLDALGRLGIDVDRGRATESLAQTTLTLGMTYRLSAYDACYLELAMRRGLPLATQDARLAHAATTVGIDIFQPAGS